MISQYLSITQQNKSTASNVFTGTNPKSRQAQSSMRSSATRELYLTKYFFYQDREVESTATPPTSAQNAVSSSDNNNNKLADTTEDDNERDCDKKKKILYKIEHSDYCQGDKLDSDENNRTYCINYEDNCKIVEESQQVERATLRQSNFKRNDKQEKERVETINADYNNEKRREYGDKITGSLAMDYSMGQRQNLVTCVSCSESSCENRRRRLQQVSVNTNLRNAISMESNITSNANNSTNIANSDNLSPVSSDSNSNSATTNSPSDSVSKQHQQQQQQQLRGNFPEPLGATASISRCSTQISSFSNTKLIFDHDQPQQYNQNQHYFHQQHQFAYNNNHYYQYINSKPSCEKTRPLKSITLNQRRNSSPNFDSLQQKKPQLNIEEQLKRLLEIDPTVSEQDNSKISEQKAEADPSREANKILAKNSFDTTDSGLQQSDNNNSHTNSGILAKHIHNTIRSKEISCLNMKKSSAGNTRNLGASGRDNQGNQNELQFAGSSRARSQPTISPDDKMMIFMLASRSTSANSTGERNARILKWLNNCKDAG